MRNTLTRLLANMESRTGFSRTWFLDLISRKDAWSSPGKSISFKRSPWDHSKWIQVHREGNSRLPIRQGQKRGSFPWETAPRPFHPRWSSDNLFSTLRKSSDNLFSMLRIREGVNRRRASTGFPDSFLLTKNSAERPAERPSTTRSSFHKKPGLTSDMELANASERAVSAFVFANASERAVSTFVFANASERATLMERDDLKEEIEEPDVLNPHHSFNRSSL